MPKAAIKLHFFLDNNVPDSLGKYLQSRGHSVQRQRFHIAADAPDQIVAMTAMKNGRILITQDKDFKNQRFQQQRFVNLSRLSLCGDSSTLLKALKGYIHLVEAQWVHALATQGVAARMIVHLQLGLIRFRN